MSGSKFIELRLPLQFDTPHIQKMLPSSDEVCLFLNVAGEYVIVGIVYECFPELVIRQNFWAENQVGLGFLRVATKTTFKFIIILLLVVDFDIN